MRTLYQFPLCPFSRKVRLVLAEKKLDFEIENEPFWEKNPFFLDMNPLGEVPVFHEISGGIFSDSMAICEYLEEMYPDRLLLGAQMVQKAEIRRLTNWFDSTFAQNVSIVLLREKVIKRYQNALRVVKIQNARYAPQSYSASGPDSAAIRNAKSKVHEYLNFMCDLLDKRKWLAGEELSLADLTAAAHISVVDYLGDLPWDSYDNAKNWYSLIKSRPSFRPLLADRIHGNAPSANYADLDF